MKYLTISLLLLVFFGCNSEKGNPLVVTDVNLDSINFYLNKSSLKAEALIKRKANLIKAYNLNLKVDNDSIKNKNFLKIAFQSYIQKDSSLFLKINKEAQLFSIKTNDSFGIADTHWNFGNYFNRLEIKDSAYFHYSKAEEFFAAINNDYYSAKMLYNMAVIQGEIRDYTGSEILTFQAISRFRGLNNNAKNLYRCYNHLGVLFKNLEEFDRSVFYYNQALEHLDDIENKGTFKESVLSNLGLVYHTWGYHNQAIQYLKEALKKETLKTDNPYLYSKLIDNIAYCKFLDGKKEGVEEGFNEALKIRDSLNDFSGIVINKLHLAEFYSKEGDTLKAIEFALAANTLSKKTNNNRDQLASLKLLSKIDAVNSENHLYNYVELTDSLQREERRTREKYTRIRFETDQYVEATERLSQQKKWLIAISAVFIIMLSLLYFFIRQRSKTKELIYEAKQQSDNEEIYKLMLQQQTNLKKGAIDERNRIAEELHDGVLSKLFGARMGMGFLKLELDENTLNQHKAYINELQEVEKEIRLISHELKNEEHITQVDLLSLVENLLEKQSVISSFKYKITSSKNIRWDHISDKIKMHLYRIIQEALSNIIKYSKAKNVKINFIIKNKLFILSVEDDGVGFNTLKNKKGIGLLNMQSRTQKLKGMFSVDSKINNGTRLTVSINI